MANNCALCPISLRAFRRQLNTAALVKPAPCISLQNVFLKDLAADFAGAQSFNPSEVASRCWQPNRPAHRGAARATQLVHPYCPGLLRTVFRQHQAGRYLLIQMAVGSLYSVQRPQATQTVFPSGASRSSLLCLTVLPPDSAALPGPGLTFQDNLLLGLGIVGGWEVPGGSPRSLADSVRQGQHDVCGSRYQHYVVNE